MSDNELLVKKKNFKWKKRWFFILFLVGSIFAFRLELMVLPMLMSAMLLAFSCFPAVSTGISTTKNLWTNTMLVHKWRDIDSVPIIIRSDWVIAGKMWEGRYCLGNWASHIQYTSISRPWSWLLPFECVRIERAWIILFERKRKKEKNENLATSSIIWKYLANNCHFTHTAHGNQCVEQNVEQSIWLIQWRLSTQYLFNQTKATSKPIQTRSKWMSWI